MIRKDSHKMIKIFYLNEQQQWAVYSKAKLQLETRHNDSGFNLLVTTHLIQFKLPQHPLPQLMTVIPLIQVYRDDCSIAIGLEMITRVERLQDCMLALKLQEWNKVLALSFRNQEYCDIILQQLELDLATINKLPCEEHQLLAFYCKELETNLLLVDWIFGQEDNIKEFLKQAKLAHIKEEKEIQKYAFKIAKYILNRADRKILQSFLKDQYYFDFLLCLSFNYEFGDRFIDYSLEYKKLVNLKNVLNLKDETVLNAYRTVMKVRFLWDVATSMFSQFSTISLFNEIIAYKNFAILTHFATNEQAMNSFKTIAQQNGELFIQLFSQLWQMFKSILTQTTTKNIKQLFYDKFTEKGYLQLVFDTIIKLTNITTTSQNVYSKFLQALNHVLSYNWAKAQILIIKISKTQTNHLAIVLLNILKVGDYNTKHITMTFAQKLTEISENRLFMKQNILNYVHSNFTTPSLAVLVTVGQIQIMVDFLVKCYKMDSIRTRRSIISQNIIVRLSNQVDNKYVLMGLLKLLKCFMQGSNEAIFDYLQRHHLYQFLRMKYFQTKTYSSKGVIYSQFLSLIKETSRCENKRGSKFVCSLIFPNPTSS